jgi:O-methyltransferase involved in polyketide biosynthesis
VSMTLPAFTPAQESLFLTLAGRALDSRLPHPFLGDTMADEILRKTGYDPLAKFPTMRSRLIDPRTKVFDIAVRAKRLDEVVRRFVARHPDAVVLDLGAGLDGRIFRIDPPSTVAWYDVDFPEVIALREQVVPHHAHAYGIGADVTHERWLDAVPSDRPAVIVADGLIAFLPQDGFAPCSTGSPATSPPESWRSTPTPPPRCGRPSTSAASPPSAAGWSIPATTTRVRPNAGRPG